MPLKRKITVISIAVIVCISIIYIYEIWPRASQEKYKIVIDNVVNGYQNSTLVFHATIKTDYDFFLPSGWDYDSDGEVDLEMQRIDTSVINQPIVLPWDYYSYGPWKKAPADNEYRYYDYCEEQHSGVYHYTFMLHGVDGWIKKPVLVKVAEPAFNITFSPVKQSFQNGENIILKAQITNNGPFPVRFMQPSIFSGTLDTFITIPNGTVLMNYFSWNAPVASVIILKSGETYDSTKDMTDPHAELNLTSRYFILGNDSIGVAKYTFNDTGTYFVMFEYQFWDMSGEHKIKFERKFVVV